MEGAFTPGGYGPAHPAGPGARSGEGLRPLRVGEVLDAAIKLYRHNAIDLWRIVACVVVPVLLIRTVIVGVALPSDSFVHNGLLYTPTGQISVPVGAGVAGAVLSVLAALIASGALAISLIDAYVGQPLDWLASIREAGGRLASLLWLAILWTVIVFIGLIAFILPGHRSASGSGDPRRSALSPDAGPGPHRQSAPQARARDRPRQRGRPGRADGLLGGPRRGRGRAHVRRRSPERAPLGPGAARRCKCSPRDR